MTYAIEEITDIRASWPGLAPLFRALHEYHAPILEFELLPDWDERQRDHLADMPDSLVLLARSGDGNVGLLSGSLLRSPGIFRGTYGSIDNAYVIPEHRRSGVATLLVERFEEWSRANGADELRLSVAAGNEGAVSFWTATSFRPRMIQMNARIG